MLNQLDGEMRKRNIQAIMIVGETTLADPNLTYAVGGNLARGGVYFKRVDHQPLLVTSNLDAPSARRLGRVRRVETFSKWRLEKISATYGSTEGYPRLLAEIARKNGVDGNLALYGRNDLAYGTFLADRLRRLGIKIIIDESPTVLESTRETKDAEEIQCLRDTAARTGHVVNAITAALRSLKGKRAKLSLKGKPATIGVMKALISSLVAAEGLGTPEGTVFSIGPSSADPHNPGTESDKIQEGKLIVFDIFPQAGSGYWHDLTRTFIVGRASRKDRHQHETVYEAQTACLDILRSGVPAEDVMKKVCEVIEKGGYRTVREVFQGKAKTVVSGFIHSLGHGVGLTIGERPYLAFNNKEPLRDRQVVTVEPGVYIPNHGGVRIEDTVLITKRRVQFLTKVDKELEIC